MLGIVSNKAKDGKKYICIGKWVCGDNKAKYGGFRFAIIQDENVFEKDFENLSGLEGAMIIETKSLIDFSPDDYIYFRGSKYQIVTVDGTRKESEQAYATFNTTGNMPITLTLRKAGK